MNIVLKKLMLPSPFIEAKIVIILQLYVISTISTIYATVFSVAGQMFLRTLWNKNCFNLTHDCYHCYQVMGSCTSRLYEATMALIWEVTVISVINQVLVSCTLRLYEATMAKQQWFWSESLQLPVLSLMQRLYQVPNSCTTGLHEVTMAQQQWLSSDSRLLSVRSSLM